MVRITSNVTNFEDFLESSIWKDLRNEFESMLDNVRDNLEIEKDSEEIRRFQGRAQALRYAIALPKIVLEELKDEVKENKEVEDGER